MAAIVAVALFSYAAVSLLKGRQRQLHGQDSIKNEGCSFFQALKRRRISRYHQASADNLDGANTSHPLGRSALSPNALNERQTSRRTSHPTILGNASHVRSGSSVDRHTSVRSVMTLPVYCAIAGNNEQVLGREGERDGVDVIVDLPTAEEEEALREEEMETIYQLRLVRRAQNAEREEMRRQRQAARQHGSASASVGTQSRATSNYNHIENLRQDLSRVQEQRQRAVPSVSYADLGVARHDGTRIRANSNESERMGLLSDAASIAVSARSDARSSRLHRREPSAISLVSVDNDTHPVPVSTARVSSRSSTPRLSSGEFQSAPSPEIAEADLGVEPLSPPEYEDISLHNGGRGLEATETPSNGPPPYHFVSATRAPPSSNTASISNSSLSSEGETASIQQASRDSSALTRLPSLRLSALPIITIERTNEESPIQP